MRTSQHLARHELIGLKVAVESPDKGMDGMTGRIVDESMSTFVLERPSGHEARVPKKGQRFGFSTPDGVVWLEGVRLAFRPEQRTKKSR